MTKRHPKTRVTSALALKRHQDDVKAYELKLAGATLFEIGVALGHPNRNWALQAIKRVRKMQLLPLVEQEAADNIERLDRLIKAHWLRATSNPPEKDSAEIVLKCIRQRCAIYGIGSAPLIGELSIGIGLGANGNAGNGGATPPDDMDGSVKLCTLEEKKAIADHVAAIESNTRRRSRATTRPFWGSSSLTAIRPPVHLEWQDLADQHPHLVIIAPVEHGKSEQFSLIRPLYELGRDPDLRIALVGETESPGKKWLSKIKWNIAGNRRLRQIYPGLRPGIREGRRELWQEKAILVQRSEMASRREKDPSIQAVGIGGQIIGARLDRIYIDDMITLRNALTETGRDGTENPGSSARSSGACSAHGRLVIVNNPWHDLDLLHKLEREFGHVYKVVRYVAGMPECAVPWWTEERLAAKRETMPAIDYARQFLCVPFTDTTGLLPIDSIRRCQDLWADPESWWGGGSGDAMRFTTAGVDLGGTDAATGSLSAIAVVGIGQDDAEAPPPPALGDLDGARSPAPDHRGPPAPPAAGVGRRDERGADASGEDAPGSGDRPGGGVDARGGGVDPGSRPQHDPELEARGHVGDPGDGDRVRCPPLAAPEEPPGGRGAGAGDAALLALRSHGGSADGVLARGSSIEGRERHFPLARIEPLGVRSAGPGRVRRWRVRIEASGRRSSG